MLKSPHEFAPSPFMKLLICKQHLHRIRAYVFGLSPYKNSHPIVQLVSYSTNRNINIRHHDTVSHCTTYYLKSFDIFSARSFSLKTTLPCSNVPNSVRLLSTVGLPLGTRN